MSNSVSVCVGGDGDYGTTCNDMVTLESLFSSSPSRHYQLFHSEFRMYHDL